MIFGAIRDFRPPLLVAENTINPGLRKWELIRGYLGAWPTPGILSVFLPPNAPTGSDGVGPASALGLQGFAGRVNDFLVLSFKRDVLAEVMPQLKLLDAQRLIRLPLVRAGDQLSVGPAEDDWRAWMRAADQ